MEKHHYDTVKKAELVSYGYIRAVFNTMNIVIPESIQKLCSEYFGFFYMDPDKDPANFVTKTDIKHAISWREQGNQFIKQSNYTAALAKYTASISYNPNDSKSRSNRCLCYLKLSDIDKASCDARFAIYNNPLWFKAWLRMAQVFEHMERYHEALNMAEHAMMLCDMHQDRTNKRLMKKYCALLFVSVEQLKETEPDRMTKDHFHDEDRDEWKYCEPGRYQESSMTDELLLDAAPFHIQLYADLIIPRRITDTISKPTDFSKNFTKYNEYDEVDVQMENAYYRWMERGWIKKLTLFRKLNAMKMLVTETSHIAENIPINEGESWALSWSAANGLYLNKRRFEINITCKNGDYQKAVLVDGTYGKPTANVLIQCVKEAILAPADSLSQIAQQGMGGVGLENVRYQRRPERLDIQYRMIEEYFEIASVMLEYGIPCILLPGPMSQDLIQCCKKYNTDPYGWNYLDLQPYYRYDRDNDI